MTFYSSNLSDLTVEDIVDYSISKISEYSEMCDDPVKILIEFMAKKNLHQARLLERLTERLEEVEKKYYSNVR